MLRHIGHKFWFINKEKEKLIDGAFGLINRTVCCSELNEQGL